MLRQWHRAAALRAKAAGMDIVYVYAAHTYLLAQFLARDINQRTDEYILRNNIDYYTCKESNIEYIAYICCNHSIQITKDTITISNIIINQYH
jgi:hypothetical protein